MSFSFANSPAYLQQVQTLLESLPLSEATSFNQARKLVFNSPELQKLVLENTQRPIVALSAGTSQQETFAPYLEQVVQDFRTSKYYREYTVTAGSTEARQALALAENLRLTKTQYGADDICLTEGSTGAITAVLEALKRSDPDAEIIIASPAYYLYKMAAEYFGLKYTEVNILSQADEQDQTPLTQLAQRISAQTRLIVVCSPTNPGGELYSQADMATLLRVAKSKNCMVMADELFAELVFTDSPFVSFASVAEQVGALDNLVTIRGYSKSKNLAGLRIGYAVSQNKKLIQQLLLVLEQRQCFPVASLFTGLICLDVFFQLVRQKVDDTKSNLREVVQLVQQELWFCDAIKSKDIPELEELASRFLMYADQQLDFYKKLYQQAVQNLGGLISAKTQTQAAFNSFVKIDVLREVDQFNFTVNLYIQTGIKIEIGPCFGWNQYQWQQEPDLGFWLRLSFSQDKQEYLRGIKQFTQFVKFYLEKSECRITTNLTQTKLINQ